MGAYVPVKKPNCEQAAPLRAGGAWNVTCSTEARFLHVIPVTGIFFDID